MVCGKTIVSMTEESRIVKQQKRKIKNTKIEQQNNEEQINKMKKKTITNKRSIGLVALLAVLNHLPHDINLSFMTNSHVADVK